MQTQSLFTAALIMGLLAVSARADDKITFTFQLPKGSTRQLTTQVALATKLAVPTPPGGLGAGAPLAPSSSSPSAPAGAPLPPSLTETPVITGGGLPGPVAVDPSAAVGMETSATASFDDAYQVLAVDANGAQALQPALARPTVTLKPVPLGFDPSATAWGISPLLKLKVTPAGAVEVLGVAEALKAQAEAAKDNGPDAGAGSMPLAAQQQALKDHLQLATYWMPKQAVGVGDQWEIQLALTLEGAESLSVPLTGTCTLAKRDQGKATLRVKGALTGTLVVDEATGWLLAADLKVSASSAGSATTLVGRITQKGGK